MGNQNRIGFLFPGQGAQYVGMGKELYHSYDEVKELFNKADEILEGVSAIYAWKALKASLLRQKIPSRRFYCSVPL